MKCVELKITGRVQGVGFRYFTQELAHRNGITGWVKNENDKSVSALACGEEKALNHFLAALKQGSALSRIDSVSCSGTQLQHPFNDFSIRR